MFDQAWPQERTLDTKRLKLFVTEEAGGRLLDLLGSKATDEETRRIEARIRDVTRGSARAITPIAVPLDPVWSPWGRSTDRAVFDADGSGLPRSWVLDSTDRSLACL